MLPGGHNWALDVEDDDGGGGGGGGADGDVAVAALEDEDVDDDDEPVLLVNTHRDGLDDLPCSHFVCSKFWKREVKSFAHASGRGASPIVTNRTGL